MFVIKRIDLLILTIYIAIFSSRRCFSQEFDYRSEEPSN